MNNPVVISALVRIIRGRIDERWDDMIERGLVASCEPVLAEALTIADAKSHGEAEEEIRAMYPWGARARRRVDSGWRRATGACRAQPASGPVRR